MIWLVSSWVGRVDCGERLVIEVYPESWTVSWRTKTIFSSFLFWEPKPLPNLPKFSSVHQAYFYWVLIHARCWASKSLYKWWRGLGVGPPFPNFRMSTFRAGESRCFYGCHVLRVPMHSPRCFFPWCSRKLAGWSQLFLGSECKGHVTHVISKKCQRRQEIQKNPSHLGPLDRSWEER